MPPERSIHAITNALPMIILAATGAIVVLVVVAIAAWLVRDIAEKAINKTTPDGVASVVLALGTLLDPLHRFLPWSAMTNRASLPGDCGGSTSGSADNGSGQILREGNHHGSPLP
jgi:hypothetical protein